MCRAPGQQNPHSAFLICVPAVPIGGEPSVDNASGQSQLSCVKRKPTKVEETTAPYAVKPTKTDAVASPGIRYASAQDVRETNAKLMQVHRKVLQKLAQ